MRVPGPTGERQQLIQTFGTTTARRDWLLAHGITHVAMESTGVYWRPVYYLPEDAFIVLLVNAAHIKHVLSRKTDVRDCAWIAQLPGSSGRKRRGPNRPRKELRGVSGPHRS